jgi:hypothetical protein
LKEHNGEEGDTEIGIIWKLIEKYEMQVVLSTGTEAVDECGVFQ